MIGLRRKNISNDKINKIKRLFSIIFEDNHLMENLKKIPQEIANDEIIKDIIHFLNSDKKRPVCKPQNLNENN